MEISSFFFYTPLFPVEGRVRSARKVFFLFFIREKRKGLASWREIHPGKFFFLFPLHWKFPLEKWFPLSSPPFLPSFFTRGISEVRAVPFSPPVPLWGKTTRLFSSN